MLGILVCGDNHFIVRGPAPDDQTAMALARHWSIIEIGGTTPDSLRAWSISSREFREDLRWAMLVPAETETSPAVRQLLEEMEQRGIRIQKVICA